MRLIDLFEAVNLQKLANEFKKEFDGEKGKEEWGDTLEVLVAEHGNCAMISETFNSWLKAKGIDSRLITVHGAYKKEWAESAIKAGEGDSHTAVVVGTTVIDFTAQQFEKSFPIPRICDIQEFEDEWNKSE